MENKTPVVLVSNLMITKILCELERTNEELYVSRLSKNIYTTYSHVVKIVNSLNELGYVSKKRKGRKIYISLTSKGYKYVNALYKVLEIEGYKHKIKVSKWV